MKNDFFNNEAFSFFKMSESNRFTRILYESGQGWGKEILPFGKPEIRTLNVINKACFIQFFFIPL